MGDDKKLKIEEQQQNDIERLEDKVRDLEEQLKYSIADFRNAQKRNEEEKIEFIKFANKELLLQLLPAFDTLLLAEKYIEDQGLKLSVKKLLEVLKTVGVERIETEGKDYDPYTMECVEVVDGEENKVIIETKPGFLLQKKTLIPSQVKVGGKKEASE